ncbi:hypothetical protein EOS93_23230 [Rhizobium sp. RMa-01]|uniref:hypothetical protein n=1 Tax=unclassified Rhizobium TaxID=2613769 RepID=UPI0008DB17A9|nr:MULTISPECIES: hypothetical protein [unclassified Rhizobium]OHV25218.1 hypothetical protein BBJ66_21435 [Rhizobium sp. RSm-3]RVU08406.1 hypothetical protein EOS93_23230 [Rhizobium sp. RMa-01]
MSKFIKLTVIESDADDIPIWASENQITSPTWINADKITRYYEGSEPVGSHIELSDGREEVLAVVETPEAILALIEGRPLPKPPAEERAVTKIVLARPTPVAGSKVPHSLSSAI